MRSRDRILLDLVNFNGNLETLIEELQQYPWDVNEALIIVYPKDIIQVLQRSINGEINFTAVENWANAIECRDDIDFKYEELSEIIFELANPEINGQITDNRLKEIIKNLG